MVREAHHCGSYYCSGLEMRISIKWLMTGHVTDVQDTDAILGPQSTIWELKGLITIAYGFPAKEIILVDKHVLENTIRLRDIGIVDQKSADEHILTAHVVRGEALESSNLEDDEGEPDNGIMEFTHEDMIVAMRMLGKTVPIGEERLREIRLQAPRSAPQFLRQVPPPASANSDTEKVSFEESNPAVEKKSVQVGDRSWSRLCSVFKNLDHGLRREGVDEQLSVRYPGVGEPYVYWDLRLPISMALQNECNSGEICVEVFFFGEFEVIQPEKFHQLVASTLNTSGVRVRPVGTPREAGCMYPLVAVPVCMSVADCWSFGDRVFEDFGIPAPAQAPKDRPDQQKTGMKSWSEANNASKPVEAKPECCAM